MQAALEQPPDRLRRVGGEPAPVDVLHDHGGERLGDPLALEQPPPGQHLVEHDAERPDVGAAVDLLALGLLGAHVRRRAEDHAGDRSGRGQRRRHRRAGTGAGRVGRQRLGQSEVEHLDLAVRGELHVGRLEVAVDHAGLVRRLERGRDLQGEVQRLLAGKRAARQPLLQVLAVDELHRQERRAVRLVDAVDPGDVRVVQRREQLGLALEARQPLGVAGERLGQDLDRDVAVERRVDRLPDDPHPTLADLLGERVVQQVLSGFDLHPRIIWGQIYFS